MFGFWLQLSDRNLSIAILVFLITFAVSIFVERRTYLSNIQSRLDTILNNYSMGVHYLEDEKLVASELTKAVRGAEQRIRAIGAKSEIIAYLKEIESAVLRRGGQLLSADQWNPYPAYIAPTFNQAIKGFKWPRAYCLE